MTLPPMPLVTSSDATAIFLSIAPRAPGMLSPVRKLPICLGAFISALQAAPAGALEPAVFLAPVATPKGVSAEAAPSIGCFAVLEIIAMIHSPFKIKQLLQQLTQLNYQR